jgi:glycosyltransferase involved in cell wall biosynthesis
VVHVRILEDTLRIKYYLQNLKFITISHTIQSGIQLASINVYDGYNFSVLKNWHSLTSGKLVVGIVGRVTPTKGIGLFTSEFFEICGTNLEFHFYGDIDQDYKNYAVHRNLLVEKNVIFHGFINDKNHIYRNIDVLLHVNEFEGLGRIFFESLDFGIPFIGINKGGIAEIAEQISYPYVFEKNQLAHMLRELTLETWTFDEKKLENSRNKAIDVFSIINYTEIIDKILL